MARKLLKNTLLAGVAAAMLGAGLATSAVAGADATDEYPIPSKILKTPCTAQQVLAAVRDARPIYYERYMIDYNNKPAADQQGARDRINWFFSMDYAGRRQYSEQTATDAFYESMAWRWPNWAKAFFNNKGVAAAATDVCMNYPDDYSVWDWPTAPHQLVPATGRRHAQATHNGSMMVAGSRARTLPAILRLQQSHDHGPARVLTRSDTA